jgi:uncharacterized protein YndB with AHSA1/START domain
VTPRAAQVVRSVVVDCHIEDVFAYVADPLNDAVWPAAVLLVDQVEGDRPGPGARYQMLERAGRGRPARPTACTCVDWQPPARIAWRWDGAAALVAVAYALEPVWTSTRLTLREEPRRRALRLSTARDVERRLRALRARLEPA